MDWPVVSVLLTPELVPPDWPVLELPPTELLPPRICETEVPEERDQLLPSATEWVVPSEWLSVTVCPELPPSECETDLLWLLEKDDDSLRW